MKSGPYSLEPQVHGESRTNPPSYLNRAVEFIHGSVLNADTVREALKNTEAVIHLAAAVGVGQSMYQVDRYLATNTLGTAVLMKELIDRRPRKLVVASSMSVYGEGLYRNGDGSRAAASRRPAAQLKQGRWELLDDSGAALEPVPTPEEKQPDLASIYALSKYDQERMCIMLGSAYRFPVTALRFFNVYGTRQALSNPYTGVLAIFGSRLLNGKSPILFEDGLQRRDFVSVLDVARACCDCLQAPETDGEVINIGSGESHTVRDIAARMAEVLGREEVEPIVSGTFRVGDIRHCFADIGKARRLLNFEPEMQLEQGLAELAGWLSSQTARDRVEYANRELERRGLRV
jgi:dTDP-L-rhamnose 4-epimerase